MTNIIQEVTERIHKSSIGLPHREIEEIVRETVEQIQREETEKLKDTVRGSD